MATETKEFGNEGIDVGLEGGFDTLFEILELSEVSKRGRIVRYGC